MCRLKAVGVLVTVVVLAGVCDAAENLVKNSSFEEGLSGWEVKIEGDWAAKADKSKVVGVSARARTGQKALSIDTTSLNPEAKVQGAFRTEKNQGYPNANVVPNYTVRVYQKVGPVKPKSWYMIRLRVRSSGVAVDEGLQYMVDIKPWPMNWGNWSKVSHWEHLNPGLGRQFLPQSPLVDDKYHESLLLTETYADTDSFEVGVSVAAPWTGEIVVDDVELYEADPAKEMTPMEKFLAMRGTRPMAKVRELSRETTLVEDGKAAGAILIPEGPAYKALGEKIQAKIRDLAGATLPMVTKLADVPAGQSIIAIGNVMENDLVARLHFNRYVQVDAISPGPGGYVIWSVPEPYGLARKQNVIVVGGSDGAGGAAGVEAFCGMIKAEGKSVKLPYLHTVFPQRAIQPNERDVPRGEWGFDWARNRFAGFSRWYLPRWLATGDLEAARLARDEIMKVAAAYLENPYFQTAWDTYAVGLAWDSIEEAPVFSDEDRLTISNVLLGYLHMRPEAGASDWGLARLMTNPTWNHQAKGVSAAYTMGRYFARFYPEEDGRYDYYARTAKHMFGEQARSSKPQENSGNYWLITMNYAIAYYLGEWDKVFFENGAMRRYAEYFATVCNNKGGISGFGDTYYCYHGHSAALGFGEFEAPLAYWYYKDGRILWWLKHVQQNYRNPYRQDVEPVEWKELVGVKKTPLERDLYDPGTFLALWGSGGEGTEGPVGDVKYEQTFDKVSLRENWDPEGQYMLLEGIGRGIHTGRATNQICKLSLLGEDLLVGSDYRGNTIRTNCSVVALKDLDINAPELTQPGPQGIPCEGLLGLYPSYATLDVMADLPDSGLVRTSLPGHGGGSVDWHRNVFWLKGKYFALIDELVAKEAGSFYAESNLSTCPHPRERYPRITPRTWRLLEGNRGFEVSYEGAGKTKHYILTDGGSKMSMDASSNEYIDRVIVRQVHEKRKLQAGESLSYINLFYGDLEGGRRNLRLERIGPAEGIVFEGQEPAAYFGCGQTEKSAAVLPIKARMFLLSGRTLAVADGASAGTYLESKEPVSREIQLPEEAARDILKKLAGLVR